MTHYQERTAEVLDAFMNAFEPLDPSVDTMAKPRFLDVGCGDGKFTLNYLLPRCLHQCSKLVAVDNSPVFLDVARQRHGHEKIDYLHLDVTNGDVEEFVKEHGTFERVYCFNLLQWVKDRAQAMKNIEELTAPGGECFVVFEHCIALFEVYMALAESTRWKKYAEMLLEKIPDTARSTDMRFMRFHLQSILNETELKPLACEVLRLPVVNIPNLKDAADRSVPHNPIYPYLNDEEKKELAKSTADIFTARAEGIADGRISNYRFTYVIHACKPDA